jgi:hypothetical protein
VSPPLLDDETCWFLAVDFDGVRWKEDVAAFVETCRAAGVGVAIERSRSGNGAHAWFCFAAPVAARTAREMGCYMITETMGRRHEMRMSPYDRLFPNQDRIARRRERLHVSSGGCQSAEEDTDPVRITADGGWSIDVRKAVDARLTPGPYSGIGRERGAVCVTNDSRDARVIGVARQQDDTAPTA